MFWTVMHIWAAFGLAGFVVNLFLWPQDLKDSYKPMFRVYVNTIILGPIGVFGSIIILIDYNDKWGGSA